MPLPCRESTVDSSFEVPGRLSGLAALPKTDWKTSAEQLFSLFSELIDEGANPSAEAWSKFDASFKGLKDGLDSFSTQPQALESEDGGVIRQLYGDLNGLSEKAGTKLPLAHEKK